MEFFTAIRELKKIFLTTRDVRRVCGNNLNIVSMCAVSPVVHTSNISNCQKKKLFQFSCGCEQFH